MKNIYILTLLLLFLLNNENSLAKPSQNDSRWPPEKYLVYYGPWDKEQIGRAQEFNLVILHPGRNLDNITEEQIQEIKYGKDKTSGTEDDVTVLAYISIGEDEEVPCGPAMSEEAGPVYLNKDKEIVKTNKNYPTRYIDEISYIFNEKGFFTFTPSGMFAIKPGHDGLPDENGKWHSYFVYAGDPEWQDIIREKMDILSSRYGVDGFFLDTLDSASPWGNYGWMQEDMALLVQKIRTLFPDKYLIINRGMFLLEKYADLIRPSIDGLMFESFISEWDWYRQIGVPHYYLESNYYVLKHDLVRESEKPDGFHLFFLNYLKEEQSDFYNLINDQMSLLKGIKYSSYISTPDLQHIYNTEFTEENREIPLPVIEDFNVKEIEKGKYIINIYLSDSEKFHSGENLYIDLKYSDRDISPDDIQLMKHIPVDYSTIKTGNPISITSFGLDKGKTYYFFLKLLGKNPLTQSRCLKKSITTKNGNYGGLISSFSAESRDGSVYLSWDGDEKKTYKIYRGNSNDVKPYKETEGNNLLVEGLTNDRIYYFSICSLSDKEEEGCLSYPLTVSPRDTNPPEAPKNLYLKYSEDKLYITWDRSPSTDLSGYCLYCFRTDEYIRLPLILEQSETSWEFEGLEKGKNYTVFVTAVDWQNNQSEPYEKKYILIK